MKLSLFLIIGALVVGGVIGGSIGIMEHCAAYPLDDVCR